MRRSLRLTIAALLLIAFAPAALTNAASPSTVRFATFNASLNRNAPGRALADLSSPGNAQAAAVAEIIQRVRPDVLLINEFDFEPHKALAKAFLRNYLNVPQNDAEAIDYKFVYVAPSNTGIHTGLDLDNNGIVNPTLNVPFGTNPTYGNDSYGFGDFPGQFGMAVFSKYPIDHGSLRTFQTFLWKDMPGAMLPDDPATPALADWYSPAELEIFRLSSKSHWDVPIRIGGEIVHFLVSHPTPPVFDGLEDRNGTRNYDEIRLWADYITRRRDGLVHLRRQGRLRRAPGWRPVRDRGRPEQRPARRRQHPRLHPAAAGQPARQRLGNTVKRRRSVLVRCPELPERHARERSGVRHRRFLRHPCVPAVQRTGQPAGGLRPPVSGSRHHRLGVFWPVASDPLMRLTGTGFPVPSSDHRAVWVDVTLPD